MEIKYDGRSENFARVCRKKKNFDWKYMLNYLVLNKTMP